jgi:hypothetical protein
MISERAVKAPGELRLAPGQDPDEADPVSRVKGGKVRQTKSTTPDQLGNGEARRPVTSRNRKRRTPALIRWALLFPRRVIFGFFFCPFLVSLGLDIASTSWLLKN